MSTPEDDKAAADKAAADKAAAEKAAAEKAEADKAAADKAAADKAAAAEKAKADKAALIEDAVQLAEDVVHVIWVMPGHPRFSVGQCVPLLANEVEKLFQLGHARPAAQAEIDYHFPPKTAEPSAETAEG